MKTKRTIFFIHFILLCTFAFAQKNNTDSIVVTTTLKSLLYICRHIDFADPKTQDSGLFYKAAPYIIFHGADKKRAWKDFARYSNPVEKKGVDAVCTKINETVNRDTAYKIVKYFSQKESEGTWHVLLITYKKKGVEKHAAYAFLKIGRRYGLGDID